MKKLLMLLVVFSFFIVLAACQDDKTTTEDETTTAELTDTNESTTKPEETTKTDPNVTVVTLAHWGIGTEEDNNIWRRRVALFNETHDNIQIEIVDDFVGGLPWEEWLVTKAAAGEFPDVLTINSVPEYVLKDYIGDIASVVKDDPEWNDIPQYLRDAVTYGDKVYAVPSSQNYQGYYANLRLIDLYGGDSENYTNFDFTVEEFINDIKAMKSVNTTEGDGIIGILNANDFFNWLPSANDETGKIQHFAWNGEKIDFLADPFIDALNQAADLYAGRYTFNAYSDQRPTEEDKTEREIIFGDNWDGKVFRNGQMGFLYDGTWSVNGLANDIKDLFDFEFVGVPGSKVIGVTDFFGISKSAKDKAAAYEVAKYLSFGKQGILDALEMIEEVKENEEINLSLDGLPVNESQEIIDVWFDAFPIESIKKMYEKVAAGEVTVLLEPNKIVPGYLTARFNYDTGVPSLRPGQEGNTYKIGDLIWDAAMGAHGINYTDLMTSQLADAINYEIIKAQLAIEKK